MIWNNSYKTLFLCKIELFWDIFFYSVIKKMLNIIWFPALLQWSRWLWMIMVMFLISKPHITQYWNIKAADKYNLLLLLLFWWPLRLEVCVTCQATAKANKMVLLQLFINEFLEQRLWNVLSLFHRSPFTFNYIHSDKSVPQRSFVRHSSASCRTASAFHWPCTPRRGWPRWTELCQPLSGASEV